MATQFQWSKHGLRFCPKKKKHLINLPRYQGPNPLRNGCEGVIERLWFNAAPRFQIQLNTLGISRAVGKPNSGRSCIQACPQGSALYYHNQNTGNGLQSTIQILPGNLLVFQLTLTVTTVYPNSDWTILFAKYHPDPSRQLVSLPTYIICNYSLP